MTINMADALGRITDPMARWRTRRRFALIQRFLESGSQSVYRYPTFRRATDWLRALGVRVGEWVRFGASCALI